MRERLWALRDAGLLAVIVVVGFLMRTVFLWGGVFTPAGVNYQDSDAWYHMRLIENVARNYPHRATIDPYLGGDGAGVVTVPILFDLIVGGFTLIVGLGSPSLRTIEVVGALTPPVLGALTSVLVYLIGARLFSRLTGLLGAFFLAIAPGQFLARSVLGFTDHHVAESFLTALTIFIAITAIQADAPRPRVILGALAGLTLSAYLMAWSGGALLVFVLVAWGVIQLALDDLHRRPDDRVALVLLPAFAITLIVLLTLQDRSQWRFEIQMTAVVAGLVVIGALAAGRLGLRRFGAPRGALLAGLVVLAVGGVLVFAAVAPGLTSRIAGDLQRFRPGATGFTVSEVRPLLLMTGSLSFTVPFLVFGTQFFLALPALAWLAWCAVRTARPELMLFVTWSALMYLATLGQNRFGYYLNLDMALLTGWTCALALEWLWTAGTPRAARSRADARRQQLRRRFAIRGTLAARIAGVVLVIVLVVVPSAWIAQPMASNNLGISGSYRTSLDWLRRNTPEPFPNPDYYYARYRPGQTPPPTYTVMAWWDYGYEIIRLGRRVPVANPTQAGAEVAGKFFTATDEGEAVKFLDDTRARYVIAHGEVPILPRGPVVQGKFETLVAWAGKDINRYWETFLTKDPQGRLGPLVLFHPEYYRTLMVRMYVFGGGPAVPQDTTYVITFAERTGPDGARGKEILESRRFKTYEGAVAYMDRMGHTGRAIVGLAPNQTPVPIEPLTRFRMIHESPEAPPAIRVFEYLGFRPRA